MKSLLTLAALLSPSSPAFACIGDPESTSLAKLTAAVEVLEQDPDFRLGLGRAGHIRNINIKGEIVTINLETNIGEKTVRVYRTTPIHRLGDGDCDKRTAVLVQ